MTYWYLLSIAPCYDLLLKYLKNEIRSEPKIQNYIALAQHQLSMSVRIENIALASQGKLTNSRL